MQRLIDGINRVLREQLSGIRVVRAFAREPCERDRFAVANHAVSDAALTAGRWQALMLPVTTLTINVSSVALIWFGGLRIDAGQMQVGSLIAFLSYFMQILMAVLMATMLLVMLPRAAVCAERITEVLQTQSAIARPDVPRYARRRGPRGAATRRRLVPLPGRGTPGARRCVVHRRARDDHRDRGRHRFGQVDTGGADLPAVRRDGGDGLDRRHRRTRLRPRGPVVRQWAWCPNAGTCSPARWPTTSASAQADASEEQMWAALRVAAADDFVRAHPDGLEMPVAQGGANFSGGQRQRLAIARAVDPAAQDLPVRRRVVRP